MKIYRGKENRLLIGIFVVAILVIICPLIHNQVIAPGDGPYHLLRIEAIKEGILTGNFPVRIHSTVMNGYGYGSGLFYPDVFLYIPATLRIIGLSPEMSYKFFVILCIVLTYITTFIATKAVSNNKYVATCAAVLIILSQYYVHNIYTRAALGEVQAYIFFPLVVWGIYNFLFEQFNKPYVIGIGFLGLMYCHTISMVIGLLVTFFVLLFNIKYILHNPSKMLKLICTAVIVLLVSCWFWLPLLEQMISGEFGFKYPWTHVADNAVFPIDLLKATGPGIGISITILCLLRLLVDNNLETNKKVKKIDWFLKIGVICIFITTKFFPWNIVGKYFNIIQFSWRFLAIGTLILSIGIALMVELIFKNNCHKVIVIILMLSIVSCINIMNNENIYYNIREIDENYYKDVKNTFDIGAGEWIPIHTIFNEELFMNPQVISDTMEQIPFIRRGTEVKFEYREDIFEYVEIPLIYYKGYSAKIVTDDAVEIALRISDEGNNGMVRVYMPSERGQVIVRYSGTLIQEVSELISIATCLAGILIISKRRVSFN